MEVKTQDLSTANIPDYSKDAELIKVAVKYPKSFEGTKFYADDDNIFVSREVADIMIGQGIGTEVEREGDEIVGKDSDGAPSISTKSPNDAKLNAKKVTGTNAVTDDSNVASTVIK